MMLLLSVSGNASRDFRAIPFLLLILFKNIHKIDLIILNIRLFLRGILVRGNLFLIIFFRPLVFAHEICNLLLRTLQELVNLTLPLVLNRVVSSLDAWWVYRVVACSADTIFGATSYLNSGLRTRRARTWSSNLSVIAFVRMLHVFTLDVFKFNLVILNSLLHKLIQLV